MAGEITQALRDRVRSRIGEASKQGILDQEIYDFLNMAQRDLALRLHDAAIEELTQIATGTLTNSRVALPSGLVRERLVKVGANDIPAKRWDVSQLDAVANNVMQQPSLADPYYFIWYNATDAAVRLCLEVGNASSSDPYDVYYAKMPTKITAAVDPDYNEEWHDLIVDMAVALCRMAKAEAEEYQRMRNEYLRKTAEANSRYLATEIGPYEGEPGDTA